MTGQILKVTTVPYQSVRISQNARLVSSDSIDLERRKAIARMKAFQSQYSSGGASAVDINYVKQINRAFSSQAAQKSTNPSPDSSDAAETHFNGISSNATAEAAPVVNESFVADSATQTASATVSSSVVSQEAQAAAVTAESTSAYNMDRGAFEFRVAKGELSFLPSFSMTIMTQRPEVHFEYIGGHNYVPPDSFDENGFMNLLV